MTAPPTAPSRRPPRLTVDGLRAGEQILTGDAAHYVRNVLRLDVGDALLLYDGKGSEAAAEVVRLERERIALKVATPKIQPTPPLRLSVGVAVPKRDRADWLVEKLTELGVSEIVWLACERSVSLPRRAGERSERWQRLARAAANQAGRAELPIIRGPEPLSDFLAAPAQRRFVGDAGGVPLLDQLRGGIAGSATLAIGPEGGFTAAELDALGAAGGIAVRLGTHVLRVETAAVAGAAMLLAAAGEPL